MSDRIFQNFHVFGSNDGRKSCDVALEHHIRKNDDGSEESKGWKIKFEMTNDAWENKKIIMLERNELVEIAQVISGKINQMSAQRNEPVKLFTFKNQGDSYYGTLKQDNELHGFKFNKYDGLRLLSLTIDAISNNLTSELKVTYGKDSIMSMIGVLVNGTQTQQKTIQEPIKQKPIELEDAESVFDSDPEKLPEGECSECGTQLDLVKEARVIEFSKKKFGRCVCFKCQKDL